ncbi:UNVERIFIED_CONTAM: hypothetical protein Sradi_5234300 [Sesamum radiatum]|uniref:Uncharacterized protein n=1 Tax=Sesamum radiatum TaxID=300843 RepID=A0AAW2LL54_SESRA
MLSRKGGWGSISVTFSCPSDTNFSTSSKQCHGFQRGYSPDHIVAILSLPECLPSNSGDYLEDSNDNDSDETGGDEIHSDDQVEEEVFGSEGKEAVVEDDHDKTNVSDKKASNEDDNDETDVFLCEPTIGGSYDVRRGGVSRRGKGAHRVRVMDIRTCYSILSHEDLLLI